MPTQVVQNARQLRKDSTDTEQKLWHTLRRRALGVKFRRQHPVPPYIADFCCPAQRLIVELDGGQRSKQQTYDAHRDAYLKSRGYRVLRFWNHQVLEQFDEVMEQIYQNISSP